MNLSSSVATASQEESEGKTRRPQVKICGITRVEDAELAVQLGADYLGLNFWPQSPRYITPEVARGIVATIGGRAMAVGVFVDEAPERVAAIDREVGLDLLQFHGDEPPDRLAPYGHRAIKVFRVDSETREPFDPKRLESYSQCGGWLFDVRHSDYGGTGEGWCYERVRDLPTERPTMVAGGINPATVLDVIERSRPDVIDICSGVESTPGIKDPKLMRKLFEEIGHEKQVRLA